MVFGNWLIFQYCSGFDLSKGAIPMLYFQEDSGFGSLENLA